jgi:hypothetical protein
MVGAIDVEAVEVDIVDVTATYTINCDCGVTGRTKASASEKEERIRLDDVARSHQRWRKPACGRIGKV